MPPIVGAARSSSVGGNLKKTMYQEIKPSKGIDDVIDTIWAFSDYKSSENFKVLPDTCVDLIFDLNHKFVPLPTQI